MTWILIVAAIVVLVAGIAIVVFAERTPRAAEPTSEDDIAELSRRQKGEDDRPAR